MLKHYFKTFFRRVMSISPVDFNLKINERVPLKIKEFLEKFPTAFIMGGFVTAALHDEEFSDIDLFFHKKNATEVFNFFGKDCLGDNDKKYFQSRSFFFQDITVHCRKITVDGFSIDLVMYGDGFNPSIHVDFSCRMLQFSHQGLRYPHYICLQDVFNKNLRINLIWFFMNELKTIGSICPPFWSICSPAQMICNIRWYPQEILPAWQQKLINNIEKYERRGYTLIS